MIATKSIIAPETKRARAIRLWWGGMTVERIAAATNVRARDVERLLFAKVR